MGVGEIHYNLPVEFNLHTPHYLLKFTYIPLTHHSTHHIKFLLTHSLPLARAPFRNDNYN